MATESPQPPEGGKALGVGGGTTEVETIELDPGETLRGVLLDVTDGENKYGKWWRLRIKDENRGLVHYFAEDRVKVALGKDELEIGGSYEIQKLTEQDSFGEGDDATDYNPVHIFEVDY